MNDFEVPSKTSSEVTKRHLNPESHQGPKTSTAEPLILAQHGKGAYLVTF